MNQITTLCLLATLVLAFPSFYYARSAAPASEVYAATAMRLCGFATAGAALAAAAMSTDEYGWPPVFWLALATALLLALAVLTWRRAVRMDEAAGTDRSGDLW